MLVRDFKLCIVSDMTSNSTDSLGQIQREKIAKIYKTTDDTSLIP